MMKMARIWIGLLLLGSACATKVPLLESHELGALHYEFAWKQCGAKPCLHETLSFVAGQMQVTLSIPKVVVGMKDLYQVIQNLRLTSKSGSLTATNDPGEYSLRTKPGEIVTIECDVIQDFEGNPASDLRYYRPLINADRFQIFGEALFIYPAWDKEKTRTVTLQFTLPSAFNFIDSYGAETTQQILKTTIRQMREGTYVGGKGVRLRHFEIESEPVWVAFMGKFGYTDDEFIDVLNRVLKTERGFWHDYEFPYYFVSAISLDKDSGGGG